MAYLVLSNGMAFEGQRAGAKGACTGELVFTTGVVGCLETITDPAYAGQIVLQTFPFVGNYGVNMEDAEGEPLLSGYVARSLCDAPSNFRCGETLESFLIRKGIPALCGVDTRELTRIVRDQGPITAMICDEIPADMPEAVIVRAGCTETALYPAAGEKKFSVTLVDFGVKKSVVTALCSLGCEVKVVPQDTSAEAILSARPDGVVLSPGPGDPAQMTEALSLATLLIGKAPVLGLGLGHQLLALAMGGSTVRMACGHRGSNHPVKDVNGSRTYITSQNHGYAVEALPKGAELLFRNVNDGTCEGLFYPAQQCLSVQFEPDTTPGSIGTFFLYERFIAMMGGNADA